MWRFRKKLVIFVMLLLGLVTGASLAQSTPMVGAAIVVISVFRIINLLRVYKGRMHEQYLLWATRRTFYSLFASVLVVFGSVWLLQDVASRSLLTALLVGQVVFAAGVFLETLRNVRRTRYMPPTQYRSDAELPTVTIAIPARNETIDLEQCLQSILANDYPKLEILVLDDCSHVRPSAIIKTFAHEGVRFIQGAEPTGRWLAKNQAYQRLYEAASGELLLYCGVDVRFGPQAIREMVNVFLSRNKSMMSVMPKRNQRDPALAIIQPMRYWWELALPRVLFNRPPVLSTCWLIRSQTLRELGTFESVRHTILPERVFARALLKTNSYSFLRSGGSMDVSTVKNLVEQRLTAVRMRYPEVRRRPELVLAISLVEVGAMLVPFVFAMLGWRLNFGGLLALPVVAVVLLVSTHVMLVAISNSANILTALISFPVAVLTELFLGYESMLKYEFSEVDWKGRNICLPVMHAYPASDLTKRA